MRKVLFVSKPVAPPWNDSTKNLVRDVSSHLLRHEPAFVRRRTVPAGFSPSLVENLDVLRYLLAESRADLWHFFFAPNWKTSMAGRLAKVIRRVPTVHTVCSLPHDGADPKELVFADRTIVLSRFAHHRFLDAGVESGRLAWIPPCVPALAAPDAAERASLRRHHGLPESAAVWIYPADLEHGGGAALTIDGFAAWGRKDALLLMASRDKTARAATERARLLDRTKRRGIEAKVRWIGETPHIHALLAASDFVLLPSRSSYAKMDYPLVALEAMCMKRPVFVGGDTPAAELAEQGGAVAVDSDAQAIAHAIETFDADEAAGDSLCRRARELVLDRFSPRRVASAYERVYEELDAA
jgi:phosphatidylinositol alpha-1,6-mannosyltransferase